MDIYSWACQIVYIDHYNPGLQLTNVTVWHLNALKDVDQPSVSLIHADFFVRQNVHVSSKLDSP